MSTQMTIRELFDQLDNLLWSDTIYLPPAPITPNGLCLVHDPDDVTEEVDLPSEALRLGYEEGMGIVDLQGVRDNLRAQGGEPTEAELLAGFIYYLENDAFLSLTDMEVEE